MSIARVRALIVIGVLTLIALTSVIWAIVRDDQTAPGRRACASANPKPVPIPNAKAIKVRVLNATENNGLAGTVANKLKAAGFGSIKTGNEPNSVEAPAEVRFGPAGVGAAQRVLAYVRGAEKVQDNKRKDATVDLVLGDQFTSVGITPGDQIEEELKRLGPAQAEAAATC
jgi:hypothetical protein